MVKFGPEKNPAEGAWNAFSNYWFVFLFIGGMIAVVIVGWILWRVFLSSRAPGSSNVQVRASSDLEVDKRFEDWV